MQVAGRSRRHYLDLKFGSFLNLELHVVSFNLLQVGSGWDERVHGSELQGLFIIWMLHGF